MLLATDEWTKRETHPRRGEDSERRIRGPGPGPEELRRLHFRKHRGMHVTVRPEPVLLLSTSVVEHSWPPRIIDNR